MKQEFPNKRLVILTAILTSLCITLLVNLMVYAFPSLSASSPPSGEGNGSVCIGQAVIISIGQQCTSDDFDKAEKKASDDPNLQQCLIDARAQCQGPIVTTSTSNHWQGKPTYYPDKPTHYPCFGREVVRYSCSNVPSSTNNEPPPTPTVVPSSTNG